MKRFSLQLCLLLFAGVLASCSLGRKKEWVSKSEPGNTAIILNGKAVPPANLPHPVLKAITAGNRIHGKPYRMGGGHKSFEDKAYDCSGTVSYLLHHAGLLSAPTTSDAFRKFGEKGEGKWITVYAKDGHTFISVAGLRMDTGYNGSRTGPRWSTKSRPTKGYVARHPPGL
jgi:hypothetical protein